MVNVIFEIRRKIKDFVLETGMQPNVIYINYSTRERLDGALKNRIALIESYPDVFQLSIKVIKTEKRFSVGVMI